MKRIFALFLILGLTASGARAQDFSWNLNSAGIWGLGTNWTPNTPAGGPSGTGVYVLIGNNITAARTITLFNTGDGGTAVKTVGRLDIGDTNATHAFTIITGTGGGILNFDGGGGNAQLNQLSTSLGDRIGAPVTLTTSLDVSNASANQVTLGGTGGGGITSSATSGTQMLTLQSGDAAFGGAATAVIGDGSTGGQIALVKNGTGTLTLQTSANTYTGGTSINAGTISFNNSSSFGSGVIKLGMTGGGSAILTVSNGSSTLANNITVAAGVGTMTLGGTSTAATGSSYTGNITLNGNLSITSLNTGATTGLKFNGNITGSGGITKIDAGVAVLNPTAGVNDYSGATIISGGQLTVLKDNALGTGNVSLTGGTVILQLQGGVTNDYIADSASISIVNGATVNLNFTGTDIVSGITIGGISQSAFGTYGSSTSGADFMFAEFMGSGTLTLIPEPATYMLFGMGLLVCAQQFRRRRTANK